MFYRNQDSRDVLGGALLGALGVFMVLYSAAYLTLGTFARMQPGMFPTILGYLLIGLGALIALRAALRLKCRTSRTRQDAEPFEWRPFIVVLMSIVTFALCITRFGLVPSIFVLTAVAALADRKLGVRGIIVLAAFMSGLIVLVFSYGLGVPLPLFRWPY